MAPSTRSKILHPSSTPPTPANPLSLSSVGATIPASGTLPTTMTAVAPGNIVITERFLSDPSWPADLILDLGKDNWPEWSRCLELLADGQGFARYLDGSLSCPDILVYPRAHWIWDNNDRSLHAFILRHISVDDYDIVNPLRKHGSCAIFKALQSHHEQLGLHAQVLTLRKALDVRFNSAKSLDDTVTELHKLYNRIISMGPMNSDNLFTVLLMNALGDQFPQLQSSIQSMARMPNFMSAVVVQRIHEENMLLQARTQQGQSTAFAALTRDKGGRATCSNCNRMGHSLDFCVQPGGKMAGKSLEDARTAQVAFRAAKKASRDAKKGQTANVATTGNAGTATVTETVTTTTPAKPAVVTSPPTQSSITVNGITYYAGTGQNPTTQTAMITTMNSMPNPSTGYYNHSGGYHAFLSLSDAPSASVDWNSHSSPIDPSQTDAYPVAYTMPHPIAACLEDCQFILDTGATCHISPERSDFKTLVPTDQHPIKGVGGAVVHAIGIGTVELRIAAGHTLTLHNVLFVPASTVRLISVLALNESGPYRTIFDPIECCVLNKSNTIIACGVVSKSRRLYLLSAPAIRVTHARPNIQPFTPPHVFPTLNHGTDAWVIATPAPSLTWPDLNPSKVCQ